MILIPNIYMACGSNFLGPSVFQSTIFGIFSPTYLEEEVYPSGTHSMLLPESSCLCIPSVRSVASRVSLAKVLFSF